MSHVVPFGAHNADALGSPFAPVPPGQHLAVPEQIKLTVAGTAAAPPVSLAKLGVDVTTIDAGTVSPNKPSTPPTHD